MLERNGLRHGGFELREDKSDWEDGRIRGLGWNSDSEVFAVWIERIDRDVGQCASIVVDKQTAELTENSAIMVHEKLSLLSQARTLLSRYAKA